MQYDKPIDFVIIATPAATIPNILRECGEHSIHIAVILSAGFSETGEQGIKLQQTILSIAAQYQIRILGPNCLGIIRPHLVSTLLLAIIMRCQEI